MSFSEENKTVSVIVPCYNEEGTIELLLDAIYQQSYPLHLIEVLISDGMSSDRTRDVIKSFSESHAILTIRIVDNIEKNIPSALNVALADATGEYIVRMDAHSIPDHRYIELSIQDLVSGKGDNVGGIWEIKPQKDSTISRSIAAAAAHPIGVGGAQYRIGGEKGAVDTVPFGAYRRSLIDEVGYYDASLLSNEDYEFNTRLRKAGKTVWFNPDIRSVYFARATLSALGKQYWRYGYWKFKMLMRYPESIRIRQAVPPLFVSCLLVLGIASLFHPLPFWVLLGILGLYLIALLLFGIQAAIKQEKLPIMLGFPAAIAVMHISWGTAFLWSALESMLTRKET